MTAAPAAIETSYAGCRFRSRLEARWAVFFDRIGLQWQYEPQGYTVGHERRPYLPDFLLSLPVRDSSDETISYLVEVKGDAARLDGALLADVVRDHSITGDTGAIGLLVLGPVPEYRAGAIPTHAMFQPVIDPYSEAGRPPLADFHEMFAAVDASPAAKRVWDHETRTPVALHRVVFVPARTVVPMPVSLGHTCEDLLDPLPVWWILPDSGMQAAYHAARSARFEHGERPAA